MIEEYLNEFFLNPNTLSNVKVTYIKNYFYPEINQFKKIKRENFQVGVNKNKNILFFRDKTNKHEEIILNLVNNKKFNNFRKNISFTIYNNNSFDIINTNMNTSMNISMNTSMNTSKEMLNKNTSKEMLNKNTSKEMLNKNTSKEVLNNYKCNNKCNCIIF